MGLHDPGTASGKVECRTGDRSDRAALGQVGENSL